ncbi:SGNH/GDSL hydrolase family protein [Thalassotalea atypica]|uniref:SGNH/GDSL hydrolase family protein n=1 Tax=Thalassotalea atypica TaxID=2054316 RepID=UPI0025734EE5|nr:SGNH/GDSL hydrolase family protein [Thalassotalea atypica]
MYTTLKYIITFPIWFVQAILVKQRAIKLPEAAGTRMHQIDDVPCVAVIGDSVAAGVGVEDINSSLVGALKNKLMKLTTDNISWYVYAKSGDKLKDLTAKLNDIDVQADYIVISIGVNDVTAFTSADKWQYTMRQLFQKLITQSPNSKILLLAIPPMEQFPLLPNPLAKVLGSRSKKLNLVSEALCQKFHQVSFMRVDIEADESLFAIDGYHPSAKSCKMLANKIVDELLS